MIRPGRTLSIGGGVVNWLRRRASMKDIRHTTNYFYLWWSVGCWGMNKRGFMMYWSMV